MIMTTAAMLAKNSTPTDIDEALAGHIRRCGTFQRIRRAEQQAAETAAPTPLAPEGAR
jgi:isoquinoline 1-oxidoreductase alpha subunit